MQLRSGDQLEVAARAAHQLQTDWPAVVGEAGGNRNRGAAGQRQHEREIHPVDVRIERRTTDLGRIALLDRKRCDRNGRAREDVVRAEERAHAIEQLAAQALGAADVRAALLQAFFDVPDDLEADALAGGIEQRSAHGRNEIRAQDLECFETARKVGTTVVDLRAIFGEAQRGLLAYPRDLPLDLADAEIRREADSPRRANKSWIRMAPRSGHQEVLNEILQSASIKPVETVEADHEQLMRALVEAGVGVGLMREALAIEARHPGDTGGAKSDLAKDGAVKNASLRSFLDAASVSRRSIGDPLSEMILPAKRLSRIVYAKSPPSSYHDHPLPYAGTP